jgi:hypothetical protein
VTLGEPPDDVSLNLQRILSLLRTLLDAIPEGESQIAGVSSSRRNALRVEIAKVVASLRRLDLRLDPIAQPQHILDPANPSVVGRLIADTLLVQPRHPLGQVAKFYGSGVYAIYYKGTFDAYEPLSQSDWPIYVGKADPESHGASTPSEQGTRLWTRLNDHRKSIGCATSTLALDDFECRYLVVRSAWQGTAETYLIDWFRPIWNNEVRICYGFGKHGDSAATRSNARSPWDTLHPGRPWASTENNVPYRYSAEDIKDQIAAHFADFIPRT